jgi:hypothetical protein
LARSATRSIGESSNAGLGICAACLKHCFTFPYEQPPSVFSCAVPCLVFAQVLHEGVWAAVLRTAGVLLVQRAGCACADELVAVSVVRMPIKAVMSMRP